MDLYKKKPLKFRGKGVEVRAVERSVARRSVRQARFSLQRTLEDTCPQSSVISQASKVPSVISQASKVPVIGLKKTQTREDMLRKWKEEKEMKKRIELLSKKPVFKIGSARPQLDAIGLSRLQESKTESFSSKVLTPNRSILKALQASRIQPASKLGDITHSKPEAKANIKSSVPARSIPLPSGKPHIARLQTNEAKPVPTTKSQIGKSLTTKSQIGKPPTTKVVNAISKSSTMHSQTRPNLAKNLPAPSNLKPHTNSGVKENKNLPAPSNLKPHTNRGVKENKIPSSSKPVAGKNAITKEDEKISTSGIKPKSHLLPRKPLNQQNKSKPVSSLQSKTKVAKEVKNEDSGQSSFLQSCPLSAIEPKVSVNEKSFAPSDFVFSAPKIRSSWLDDEGPCTILSRVMKEMNFKLRTSTPIKKDLMEHQELEGSFEAGDSENTKKSSTDAKEQYSTLPNSDTKYIESLIENSAAKISEVADKKAECTFSIEDNAEDSKSVSAVVSSDVQNQGLELDISAVNKNMQDLALSEKGNLLSDVEKEDFIKPNSFKNQELETLPEEKVLCASESDISAVNKTMQDFALSEKGNLLSDVEKEDFIKPNSSENQEPETLPEEKVLCVSSEKNPVDLYDEGRDCGLKEVTEDLCPTPCEESTSRNQDSTQNPTNEAEISVFYPSDPVAVPQKGKRFFSSCWKMEKPSLALISESPENSKDVFRTPKSHRKKGFLAEEFTPRRSMRLARKSELKEENIFDVQECFLDSPSVEAATRMTMRPYDFDRLHLEASISKGQSEVHQQSISAHKGKVSLLYTPPRTRASVRNKSLKGDLMTFSPNVE